MNSRVWSPTFIQFTKVKLSPKGKYTNQSIVLAVSKVRIQLYFIFVLLSTLKAFGINLQPMYNNKYSSKRNINNNKYCITQYFD